MFALFFSLYLAMFRGIWYNFTITEVANNTKASFNAVGTFLTSIFNNVSTPMTDLGDTLTSGVLINGYNVPNYLFLVAFVLALITSIGIVVVATKGIKKIFTVFFYGVR